MTEEATRVLNEVSGALDSLAVQIAAIAPNESAFMELWGWNMPAMSGPDFAAYVRSPKALIQSVQDALITADDVRRLSVVAQRIQYILGNVVNNLPGGNATNVYIVINSLVENIETILSQYIPSDNTTLDLKAIEDRNLLPASQLRVLRRTASAIERLGVEQSDLQSKVDTINAVHLVAQELPADVQSLADARSQYAVAQQELADVTGKANESLKEVQSIEEKLVLADVEAQKVLDRANSAYSAATTVGLGAAFAERASKLHRSTLVLGLVLLVALGCGATITFFRVEFVHKLMLQPNVNFNVLWVNVTFTALSVSAPVWLAWILTRQIGQRFRLAEDYGYKAAVAKAYEGYRAEAAQIDSELTKRLFGIALDRLGEAPLRLVEKDSPGSPAHEAQGPIRQFFARSRPSKDGAGGSEG